MRMLPVLAVAFGLGLVLIFYSAVGVGGLFDSSSGDCTDCIEGEVNKTAEKANESSVDPEESTGFFSFVGSAINTLVSFAGVIVYLPSTLERIGFIPEFADLIGRAIQVIIVIGLIQVAIQWEVR